jgi:hypothetical protein
VAPARSRRRWRTRLILALNMVRIESLSLVASDPRGSTCCICVWPVALVLATGGT